MAGLQAGGIPIASFGIQKLLFKISRSLLRAGLHRAIGNVTSFRVRFLLVQERVPSALETFKPQCCPVHAPMGVCVAFSLFQILAQNAAAATFSAWPNSSPSDVGTPPERACADRLSLASPQGTLNLKCADKRPGANCNDFRESIPMEPSRFFSSPPNFLVLLPVFLLRRENRQ